MSDFFGFAATVVIGTVAFLVVVGLVAELCVSGDDDE